MRKLVCYIETKSFSKVPNPTFTLQPTVTCSISTVTKGNCPARSCSICHLRSYARIVFPRNTSDLPLKATAEMQSGLYFIKKKRLSVLEMQFHFSIFRCDRAGLAGTIRLAAVRCPAGLAFDINRQTCDWKAKVDNCDRLSSMNNFYFFKSQKNIYKFLNFFLFFLSFILDAKVQTLLAAIKRKNFWGLMA